MNSKRISSNSKSSSEDRSARGLGSLVSGVRGKVGSHRCPTVCHESVVDLFASLTVPPADSTVAMTGSTWQGFVTRPTQGLERQDAWDILGGVVVAFDQFSGISTVLQQLK